MPIQYDYLNIHFEVRCIGYIQSSVKFDALYDFTIPVNIARRCTKEVRPFSQLPLPGVSCCDVSSSITGTFSNFREYNIGSVKLSHFDSRTSRFNMVGEDNVLQHIMHSCLGRTGSGISDIVRPYLNQ